MDDVTYYKNMLLIISALEIETGNKLHRMSHETKKRESMAKINKNESRKIDESIKNSENVIHFARCSHK